MMKVFKLYLRHFKHKDYFNEFLYGLKPYQYANFTCVLKLHSKSNSK